MGGVGTQHSKGARDLVRVQSNTDRNDDTISGSCVWSVGKETDCFTDVPRRI